MLEEEMNNTSQGRLVQVAGMDGSKAWALDASGACVPLTEETVVKGKRKDPLMVGDWLEVADDGSGQVLSRSPRRSVVKDGPVTGLKKSGPLGNLSRVFVCQDLTRGWNPERVQDLIDWSWSAGAQPSLILTGIDCIEDLDAIRYALEEQAFGLDLVYLDSSLEQAREELVALTTPGELVVFVGDIRVADKPLPELLAGREPQGQGQMLYPLDNGAMVFWPGDDPEGAKPGEDDLALIANLALECRFGDCRHDQEPGCAVKKAVKDGRLAARSLVLYREQMQGQWDQEDLRLQSGDEESGEDFLETHHRKGSRGEESHRKRKKRVERVQDL